MIQQPKVFGLVLCRALTPDPATGELSLTGIFQALEFSTWPSPVQPFTAYALLYDGAGEGTMELVATQLETERVVYTNKRWFIFPGRGLSAHVCIPVRRCVFPAPGRYGFALRFDNEELTWRHLDIYSKHGAS